MWNSLHLSHRNENSKGFTLAEILIAISIVSTILAILYGSFSSATRSITLCREKNDMYQVARLSLDMMTADISSSFPPKDLQLDDMRLEFIGEDREAGGIPWDSLHFISTSNLELTHDAKSSGLHEIGYYMETDPESDEPVLFRRQDDTPDDETDKGGIALELADGVNGLNFTYYDDKGEEAGEWFSSETKTLPKMVRITLSFKDEDGEITHFSTQVYLEMWDG